MTYYINCKYCDGIYDKLIFPYHNCNVKGKIMDDSFGIFKPKSGPSIQNPMNHEPKFDYTKTATEEKCSSTEKIKSRQQILETANNLTSGNRNNSYGEPINNMDLFANLVDTYLIGKRETDGTNDLTVDAVDAAVIMVLSKIARIAMNRGHVDNYVDGAAYMAIAGECDKILKERGDYEG